MSINISEWPPFLVTAMSLQPQSPKTRYFLTVTQKMRLEFRKWIPPGPNLVSRFVNPITCCLAVAYSINSSLSIHQKVKSTCNSHISCVIVERRLWHREVGPRTYDQAGPIDRDIWPPRLYWDGTYSANIRNERPTITESTMYTQISQK